MALSNSYPIPQNMLDTIDACTAGLGAVGVIGGLAGPGTDAVIIIPTWVGMAIKLADQSGRSMDNQTAKKLCMAVLTGVGTFALGTKVAATVGSWLLAPFTGGLSLAANVAVNVALNATLTRVFGRALARFFLQTENIENLELATRALIAMVGLDFGIAHTGTDIVA